MGIFIVNMNKLNCVVFGAVFLVVLTVCFGHKVKGPGGKEVDNTMHGKKSKDDLEELE